MKKYIIDAKNDSKQFVVGGNGIVEMKDTIPESVSVFDTLGEAGIVLLEMIERFPDVYFRVITVTNVVWTFSYKLKKSSVTISPANHFATPKGAWTFLTKRVKEEEIEDFKLKKDIGFYRRIEDVSQ